jgi:hypothetical protein
MGCAAKLAFMNSRVSCCRQQGQRLMPGKIKLTNRVGVHGQQN